MLVSTATGCMASVLTFALVVTLARPTPARVWSDVELAWVLSVGMGAATTAFTTRQLGERS